jgi:hypothetical protein
MARTKCCSSCGENARRGACEETGKMAVRAVVVLGVGYGLSAATANPAPAHIAHVITGS